MKFKIISDSSCDLTNDYFLSEYGDKEIGLNVIPFTVDVDGVSIVDENVNVADFLSKLKSCKKANSACPSPYAYESVCTAEYNFIITIGSKLSGSYNSALVAAKNSPNKVFVIDSAMAAAAQTLIVEKIYSLIKEGKEYEEICAAAKEYTDGLTLFFTLANYDNLVRKGRIKLLIAKIISIARIKTLCKAHDGEIAMDGKFLSYNQCLNRIKDEAVRANVGAKEKRDCVITSCDNDENAEMLKDKLLKENIFNTITVRHAHGLNAFYMLEKSLIISY